MYLLFACTLFMCAPEPLAEAQTLKKCHVKALELAVEGVKYRCLKD